MANVFQIVDWVGNESLRVLMNKLVVAEWFNTDYNKEFTKEFAVGEDVRVKYPQRFLIRDGLTYSPQPINRRKTDIVVDQPFGIDFEYDSIDQALKMERGEEWFSKEYIVPAMDQIAQEMDSRAANYAWSHANNIVGSMKTTPTDTSLAGAALQRLIENAYMPDDLRLITTPASMTSIANGSLTLFNPPPEISKIWKKGAVGEARSFEWFQSMSLYQNTAGVWQVPSAVTVNGSNQQGTALNINCTSGDTFKTGDVFNIALVNNANPGTRRSTGVLRQLRVTQDATINSTTGTIQISGGDGQGIVGPGDQYQNVDSLPTDTALLTLFPGTTSPSGATGWNSLAMGHDAFALVGVKMMLPKAVEMSVQKRDPKTGIAVSFIRAFDPIQRKMVNRFDTLIGFGELYSNACAVRIMSAT